MMNLLDILLVVVVAVFTLRGLLRGLVKEVFTLAAVVAGFILSNLYHELPAPLLERFISGPSNVKAAGYILVFTLTLVATFILYKLIALCVKISLAKWLDYSTGALFGLIEGTVISAFLVLLLTNFLPGTDFLAQSKLVPHITAATAYAMDHSPKSVQDMLRQTGLDIPGAVQTANGSENAPNQGSSSLE